MKDSSSHNVWFKDSRREDGKDKCENDDDEGVRHMGEEGLVVMGDIIVRGRTSRLKLEVVENVVFEVSDEKEQSGLRPGISLHSTRRPGNVFFSSWFDEEGAGTGVGASWGIAARGRGVMTSGFGERKT